MGNLESLFPEGFSPENYTAREIPSFDLDTPLRSMYLLTRYCQTFPEKAYYSVIDLLKEKRTLIDAKDLLGSFSIVVAKPPSGILVEGTGEESQKIAEQIVQSFANREPTEEIKILVNSLPSEYY
jgi:hypothetical protein